MRRRIKEVNIKISIKFKNLRQADLYSPGIGMKDNKTHTNYTCIKEKTRIGWIVLEQCFAEVLEAGVECIHRRSRLRCYGTLTSPKNKQLPS